MDEEAELDTIAEETWWALKTRDGINRGDWEKGFKDAMWLARKAQPYVERMRTGDDTHHA